MSARTDEAFARRKIIGVNEETVTNVSSKDFPHHYTTSDQVEDPSWFLRKFQEGLEITFHEHKPFDTSFSLIGIDASIANAFRRIMIAEVPTLALEQVYIKNNTSIIHDEILAQRLGLVPLAGDPAFLEDLKPFKYVEPGQEGGSAPYWGNSIALELKVECMWQEKGKERARQGETDPKQLYNNSSIYAHQLEFVPSKEQTDRFPACFIKPVNPEILIAKMRPGQKIDILAFAVKGIGEDHAKFSPVATATYRMLPVIEITRPILGADADKFARCFNRGVITKSRVTEEEASREGSGYEGHEGEMKAVVSDPFKDTVSRECLRHPEFKGKVRLGRAMDHFIFKVESTGQFTSDEVFLESVRILKQKAKKMVVHLDNLVGPPKEKTGDVAQEQGSAMDTDG
ncbi:putative DNA-directed RNA polymerase I and III subunit Rpc40 [Rhizodiscina lignyota]|uniref:DNA-directed RNA polymerases I and III subunit RPAC1 n=1 Tax=Rhizodiscina lignyota TaxID=1504668 RepID=A0A9P4IEA0_9PEZI|nr:putative DNA-directed RNA polymerase I and III subunit Rpc40 [Rhizodiscina lignyota]